MRRITCLGSLALIGGFALAAIGDLPKVSLIAPTEPGSMDLWQNCPMNGSITNPADRRFHTNELKNRYIAPTSAPFLSFRTFLESKTDSHPKLNEDRGATIEGYVGKVIFEVHGSGNDKHSESCNCDNTGTMDADEHIYLLATKKDLKLFLKTKDKSRVVDLECTPRVKELAKRAGFTWTNATLSKLIGHKIRVKGWLFNDWQHAGESAADGATTTVNRGTVWEIHPITYVQILS